MNFGIDILHEPNLASKKEWIETDGLGGYASGTICGLRTRRYHALFLAALRPPTERRTLVQSLEEYVSRGREDIALSSHRYLPDVIYPDGLWRLTEFRLYPWPTWVYAFTWESGEESVIEKEILVPRGEAAVLVTWTLKKGAPMNLKVNPLLSCRDHHAAARFNNLIDTGYRPSPHGVSWKPYPASPAIFGNHNGVYRHAPDWYMNFTYDVERERGLDTIEDLWSPGTITYELSTGKPAALFFALEDHAPSAPKIKAKEKKRRGPDPVTLTEVLDRSAEAYIVERGKGRTIVAGYPWFTDWGRDTFIAMRGLLLARKDYATAKKILLEWAGHVNEGMLPNHFPDEGENPVFNSVDASLWFVIVAGEYQTAVGKSDAKLIRAMSAIMKGYIEGTRYGIGLDTDGLMRAGVDGWQLTWMDAKVDDECFTPRIGKPVEIQALWLNALAMMGDEPQWKKLLTQGRTSFRKRFWNARLDCLYDVVDSPNGDDAAIRPNQIFAVSLPLALLGAKEARAVVDAVERDLLTPLGLRTLAPLDPNYIGLYTGDRRTRDAAYHNGPVWPWLLGPFIEAWVKVRKSSKSARHEARQFLAEIEAHIGEAGLGHISEIVDGDAPHEPRGCPFQAWSVGETLRILREVV